MPSVWLANWESYEADWPRFGVLERLLYDGVHALTGGGVQNAAVAQPEGDVVGLAGIAEADEVAWACVGFVDFDRGSLLLMRIPGNEPAESAVRHMDETGAVDATFGQAAPFVRSAQVGAGRRQNIVI